MATILSCRGTTPEVDRSCFLAPNAIIVGDVRIAAHCSVWFNAVIRGDVNRIRIGSNSNVQDGAVIHCTYEKTSVDIGSFVSIGHQAIVHGAKVEDFVLIGMGAIVMDNVHIGHHSLVGAGSVVLEGTKIEPYSVWAGNPAKFIKTLPDRLKEGEIERIARNYSLYSSWFKD
ncbi:MAG TPA: gamma carbonic anhydrase family protein [Flavobacteriales bacterium]|jgi:carbonic anhydrase/acetyltransferase-like protein (isoleucine patch superfamily)|nr:gamma carbonic anhydrase family protein [Flavobacteriales bacterium]